MTPQPRSKYDNGRSTLPVLDRILAQCVVNERGCWIWQGGFDAKWGYGKTYVGSRRDGTRRNTKCHIATYEAKYGPVPEGLTLDHVVCDTPICCNPDHVSPATMRENTLRSATSPTAVNARKTHCPKGHPLSGENLRMRAEGRVCRTCQGWTGRVPIIQQEQTCDWCDSTYYRKYFTTCCSKTCAQRLRNS